jgi:hypothetical protein
MHPSWRDLVIEQLSTNDQARHKFLTRCGRAGFLLALSVAGGSTGTRQMPLLRHANDWQALCEAAPRVLRYGSSAQREVLGSLHSALITGAQTHSAKSDLGMLGYTILATLRDTWSNGEQLPDSEVLRRFYAASERLTPLPAGPDLQPIWTASFKTAQQESAGFQPGERQAELGEVHDWLKVVDVIAANEPRFLRQVGFPDRFSDIAATLLVRLKSRAELRFEFDYGDECTAEEWRMDLFGAVTHQIEEAFPMLKANAKETWRKLRENERRVEELRHEFEDDARQDEHDDRDGSDYGSSREEPSSEETSMLDEYVDVGRLFADL